MPARELVGDHEADVVPRVARTRAPGCRDPTTRRSSVEARSPRRKRRTELALGGFFAGRVRLRLAPRPPRPRPRRSSPSSPSSLLAFLDLSSSGSGSFVGGLHRREDRLGVVEELDALGHAQVGDAQRCRRSPCGETSSSSRSGTSIGSASTLTSRLIWLRDAALLRRPPPRRRARRRPAPGSPGRGGPHAGRCAAARRAIGSSW